MAEVDKNCVVLRVWDGTLPSHKISPAAIPEV